MLASWHHLSSPGAADSLVGWAAFTMRSPRVSRSRHGTEGPKITRREGSSDARLGKERTVLHPGHIRQAFEDWIYAGRPEVATVEVHHEPRQVPARKLLGMLWHCTDIMPGILCSQVDMEPGTVGRYPRRRWSGPERREARVVSLRPQNLQMHPDQAAQAGCLRPGALVFSPKCLLIVCSARRGLGGTRRAGLVTACGERV